MEILEFLKQENISDKIISEISTFRSFYKLEAEDENRSPKIPISTMAKKFGKKPPQL